tara:strand:- start:136 stop:552 length:417 start_codon:yes stop_codon:yes gene_type:complete
MDEIENSFLGKGWAFPPTFKKNSGDIEMSTEYVDIKESLEIYFGTRLGERIMRSDYGSVIHELFFKSSNNSSLRSVELSLERNLRQFEPRIIVESVKAERLDVDGGLINFNVNYVVRSTNIRDNIVFPFYINEGTNIK